MPALLVMPPLALFVCLIWDTAMLSREKIRHQFAVDTAMFMDMRNYSELLNLSAWWVNGANVLHNYYEAGWPRYDPATHDDNCVGVPKGYRSSTNPPDCVIDGKYQGDLVFRVFYQNGLFPVLSGHGPGRYDPDNRPGDKAMDQAMDDRSPWSFEFNPTAGGVESDPGSNADWNGNVNPQAEDFATICQFRDAAGNTHTVNGCLDVWRWENFSRLQGTQFNVQHFENPPLAIGRYSTYYVARQQRFGDILSGLYNAFKKNAGDESAASSGQSSYALGYECNIGGCAIDMSPNPVTGVPAGHLLRNAVSPSRDSAADGARVFRLLLSNFNDSKHGFIPHCTRLTKWYSGGLNVTNNTPTIVDRSGSGIVPDENDHDPGGFLHQNCNLGPSIPGPDYGVFRLVTIGKETLDHMRYPGGAEWVWTPGYDYQVSQGWNAPLNHFGVDFGGLHGGCPGPCAHATVSLATRADRGGIPYPGSLWPDPTPKFQAELFP